MNATHDKTRFRLSEYHPDLAKLILSIKSSHHFGLFKIPQILGIYYQHALKIIDTVVKTNSNRYGMQKMKIQTRS